LQLVVNGVLLTQANRWASHVARVDLYLEKDEAGHWRVVAKSARTIPVTEKTAIDPEIAELGKPYDKETQDWLSRAIGESAEELTARDGRFKDTAIIDLIQRVQIEAGKADVSMAAARRLPPAFCPLPTAQRTSWSACSGERSSSKLKSIIRQSRPVSFSGGCRTCEHRAQRRRPARPKPASL